MVWNQWVARNNGKEEILSNIAVYSDEWEMKQP